MRKHSLYLFKRCNGVWYILDKRYNKDIWRSTGQTTRRDAARLLREYKALHTTTIPTDVIAPVTSCVQNQDVESTTPSLSKFEKEFFTYAEIIMQSALGIFFA